MSMNEKTYHVVAAVESLPAGKRFVAEATPRLAALVGAGYIIEETAVETPEVVEEAKEVPVTRRRPRRDTE